MIKLLFEWLSDPQMRVLAWQEIGQRQFLQLYSSLMNTYVAPYVLRDLKRSAVVSSPGTVVRRVDRLTREMANQEKETPDDNRSVLERMLSSTFNPDDKRELFRRFFASGESPRDLEAVLQAVEPEDDDLAMQAAHLIQNPEDRARWLRERRESRSEVLSSLPRTDLRTATILSVLGPVQLLNVLRRDEVDSETKKIAFEWDRAQHFALPSFVEDDPEVMTMLARLETEPLLDPFIQGIFSTITDPLRRAQIEEAEFLAQPNRFRTPQKEKIVVAIAERTESRKSRQEALKIIGELNGPAIPLTGALAESILLASIDAKSGGVVAGAVARIAGAPALSRLIEELLAQRIWLRIRGDQARLDRVTAAVVELTRSAAGLAALLSLEQGTLDLPLRQEIQDVKPKPKKSAGDSRRLFFRRAAGIAALLFVSLSFVGGGGALAVSSALTTLKPFRIESSLLNRRGTPSLHAAA
jgi:hypothetical protein